MHLTDNTKILSIKWQTIQDRGLNKIEGYIKCAHVVINSRCHSVAPSKERFTITFVFACN